MDHGRLFSFRPLSPPGSADQYRLIRSWIQACDDEHAACKLSKSSSGFLPTRLLDVSDVSQLKIVSSRAVRLLGSAPVAYIALSYCWGKGPFLYVTTLGNIEARARGFEESALPRTIRDAIAVTRQLQVRYIWVDALCILQGQTPEAVRDCQRELQHMCDVYRCAHLTIATASAASVADGIFNPYSVSSAGFNIKLSSRNSLYDGIVRAGDVAGVNSIEEPLYKRAWTLQERLLSRRYLVFNRDQVRWECQTTECGERPQKWHHIGTPRRLPRTLLSAKDRQLWPVLTAHNEQTAPSSAASSCRPL